MALIHHCSDCGNIDLSNKRFIGPSKADDGIIYKDDSNPEHAGLVPGCKYYDRQKKRMVYVPLRRYPVRSQTEHYKDRQ